MDTAKAARAAGLTYVNDGDPGIRRERCGKTFRYFSPRNRRVVNERELKRIVSLAVPPAYEQVWICTQARGHIQATGRDQRGRKQYRYHAEFRALREQAKFDRMIHFGRTLPRLRKRLRHDLARPGLPREKVLAVLVTLLDTTRARVGNEEYARANRSYGLSTLRDRHVRFVRDGRAVLRYRGKSGIEHEVMIDDRRLVRLVRRCQELPGQLLFQYVDDEGVTRPVDSDQINEYLREVMGEAFTAKDFRTWGATIQAILVMARTPLPEQATKKSLNGAIVAAVKQVAEELRNTPAVCRKSYINPLVFDSWRSGHLHAVVDPAACTDADVGRIERAALRLLRYDPSHASSGRNRNTQLRAQAARAGSRSRGSAAHP